VFLLKKAVSYWLMPLPLCLALLVAGAALLVRGRNPRRGRLLVAVGAILLLILSSRPVSSLMLGALESRFPAIPERVGDAVPGQIRGCAYVVVLGGGNSAMPGKPATSLLSTSALARLVEAVRILRMLPEARLIVSGPGEARQPTHASVLASAAVSLGIDRARITLIETARDTEEESKAVAGIVGGSRVALVTSAWHMPRAYRLFRDAGTTVVPCPADYVSRSGDAMRLDGLLWGSDALERSTLALHEWLGLAWLDLKGSP